MTGPACRDDAELMHDDHRVTDAKRVCAACPVVGLCRQGAVEHREPWGVWGGLTVAERERHRLGRPVVTCSGCGLDCVPAAGNRCHQCHPAQVNHPGAAVGPHLHDLLVALTVERWPAPDIGALIGCRSGSVLRTQRRWGLDPTPQRPSDRATRPHGTDAAIRRHQRRREPLCAECRQAAAYGQEDHRRRAAQTNPT